MTLVVETSATNRYVVLTEQCTLGDVGAVVHLEPSPAVTGLVMAGHIKVETATKTTREAKPETEDR